MDRLLRVENLSKTGILKDISFTVYKGEMIAVMGPSGSGKSTLLYNVSGMDNADGGKVWLKDTEIVGLSEEERSKIRLKKMGFVFQHMNVLSNLNVIDNIMFPAVYAMGKKNEKQIREKALKIFKACDGFGFSRVDFFLENGTNRVVFNEINTIPGHTAISMYPMLMKAAGYDMADYVDKLIEMSHKRHE